MPETEWRRVAGYPYWVSSHGSIRRDGSSKDLKPQMGKRGYFYVNLWKNNKRKAATIHRLVAQAFIPHDNPDLIVLHGKGGVQDNSVDNLRWGTHEENSFDSFRDGTNYESNKPRCDNGHEFINDNVRLGTGGRKCKACMRANSRVQNHRRLYGVCYTKEQFLEISDIYYKAIQAGERAIFVGTSYQPLSKVSLL